MTLCMTDGGLPPRLAQLQQLMKITWDGDLISSHERNELVKRGYAMSWQGFNGITIKGLRVLLDFRIVTT